jgi:hypothetical protein
MMTTQSSARLFTGMPVASASVMLLAATLGLGAVFGPAIGPALADKVGVAAAVNPDAFSSLSGTPNQQLNIGKSIFFNERINTTNSGLVQVLLVDGSTFTVGPNSNLTIDRFVYDPRKKTGEMVATFSKGTMRFIGGKLSKNDGGVTVNTPSGALAIRGGMFQGSTSRGVYSFLFGDSLTFRGNNGQTQTVYETGYSLVTSGGRANIRPTTPEDTNAFMQALSSTGTNFGSGTTGTGGPANPDGVQQADIENAADQQVSDANFVMVQTSIQQQLAKLAKLQDQQSNPPQNNPPKQGGGVEPPVKEGGEFRGYASGFLQTGTNGTGTPEFLIDGSSHVVLDTDPDNVTADIQVTHVDQLLLPKTTTFNLGFGGQSPSTYTDDYDFLALADDGTSTVVRSEVVLKGPWWRPRLDTEVTKFEGPDVTHTSPPNGGGFTSLPNAPLCEDCDFLRYGTWASDVTYGQNTDKMGGWWVATNEPISPSDMPTQGTASYAGMAVGTFASRGQGNVWSQQVSQGNMDMDWNFSRRRGNLAITNFAGKNFNGTMHAPGRVDFSGVIAGSGGVGAARGSFVGSPGAGLAPKGVMGDFGIGNNQWRINGVYGGSLQTYSAPH